MLQGGIYRYNVEIKITINTRMQVEGRSCSEYINKATSRIYPCDAKNGTKGLSPCPKK